MPLYTDQLNRKVEIPAAPQRIVSLVPSLSELLWDLGLQQQLAGITKFCIHPNEMFRTVTRVGGTKKVNIDVVEKIQPDLIIGNKEENTREDIEKLEKKFPVLMTDINTFDEAINAIALIGEITGKQTEANHLITEIRNEFSSFKKQQHAPKVIYLIWKDPYMAVGTHTFIHDMLWQTGMANKITEERYPEITLEKIKQLAPEILILSTEPFPFTNSDVDFFRKELPQSKIWLADGEMFTWYGSRMKKLPAYITLQAGQLA
jgi:ABC-type Fe3+-hydroxamate transport system substrate-binding protein